LQRLGDRRTTAQHGKGGDESERAVQGHGVSPSAASMASPSLQCSLDHVFHAKLPHGASKHAGRFSPRFRHGYDAVQADLHEPRDVRIVVCNLQRLARTSQ
jgi:hypothetical protein